jgi:hypothetical protein
MINDRSLASGARLVGHYKKVEYHATVVEGETGGLRYRLDDGREFKSPSAAATAITNHPMNGWAFWSRVAEAPAHAPEEGNCPTEDEMVAEERLAAEAGHPVLAEAPARQRDARGHYLPQP